MIGLSLLVILAMSPRTVYILLVILLFIGVVMLFITIREVFRTLAFLRAAQRTDGIVVRFEPYRNSEGITKRRAVVEFKTLDNRTYEILATVAYIPPAPPIGATVTVRYLPHSPHEAMLESFWEIWEKSLFYVLVFFAMLFFVSILSMVLP